MLDIKKVRENPEIIDKILEKRNHPAVSKDLLLADEKNRNLISELQKIQEERNSKSKLIGGHTSQGKNDEAEKLKGEVGNLKSKMQELEEQQKNSQNILEIMLAEIPNLPDESVPVGDESNNKEIKIEGKKKDFSFEIKEHFDLGENLDLMNFEQAANISGARFVVQKGKLARLERAMANFMLDLHTTEFGYQEINVPILVKDQALFGTGQLPKF
ncbi:uncharacterized protein METZ01_LOCUS421087, partial [marine metagenome]